VLRRRVRAYVLVLGVLMGTAGGAGQAQAEVLHLPGGHFAGVTPANGVVASRLPGAVARATTANASSSGQLAYNGGPVVHASAPYLIVWTPPGHSLPSGAQSLLSRYFTDVAADSGTGANVYGVSRQYYDGSGFADYRQTFSAGQVIVDSDAYPTRDRVNCPSVTSGYPSCVTDAQLEAELQHLVTVDHLPTDGPATSETLPATAPIYFLVLPSDVNICAAWGSTPSCANNSSNGFCAYHSAFTDTLTHTSVLYATIPTVITGTGQNPKTCQWDGNTAVQEPNASAGDVALKYLSHEDSETITDPFGDAWWNATSGNENGDNCNAYGTANPDAETSPNAFAPTLGGTPTGSPFGSLYNQLIGPDRYYLQSEWSNGDGACTLRPTSAGLSASFSAPSAITPPHSGVRLDPSASTSSAGWSSATWNFGDAGAPVFLHGSQSLSAVSHTYAADGTYTATLTLVDGRGNVATASRAIRVDEPPTASFAVATPTPGAGQTTAFDASASSDPDGTITSYAWDFGDGNTATGRTPSNTYQSAGTYTVTLKVTDSDGDTATTSHPVAVAGPLPSFSSSPAQENAPVGFDGSSSSDTSGAAITSWTWNFGDGVTQSGSSQATHTYATYGPVHVTLTLTDANGYTSSLTELVTVADEPPSATFAVTTAAPGSGQATSFDASASSDPDGTIVGYAWDFGDGTAGTGAAPSHVYTAPGTYVVTLTVTDSDGDTAGFHASITVAGPLAQFTAPAAQLEDTLLSFSAANPGPSAAGPVTDEWSFGDGTTASGATATHAYTISGIYPVTLTVTDANDDTMTVTHTVTVLDTAPTAAFAITTTTPSTQGPVAFDASASSDPDDAIASYAWNFGDGATGSGIKPTHLFVAAGTYTVTLTVTDASGQASAVASHPVTVYAPPQAAFTAAGGGDTENLPVRFDAGASSDPGVGGPITSYAWSFGDGTGASGVAVAHTYTHPGTFAVTLTVTNAVGLSSAVIQWVTVGDEPPIVMPRLLTHQPLVGSPVAFDGSASSDPDGHVVSYGWTFGDGSSAIGARPTHTYRTAGHFSATLTVRGSGGEQVSQSVTVIVVVPGRITRVQARQGATGPSVLVSVNGPGRLRVGSHNLTVHAAGTAQVQLRLSSGELRALASHQTVHIRTGIAFTPTAGPPSHRVYTLTLRRPANSHLYRVVLRPTA
jgi:PKD repeat protein